MDDVAATSVIKQLFNQVGTPAATGQPTDNYLALKAALNSLKSPAPALNTAIEEPARLPQNPPRLAQQDSILDH